jgi:adenosylcobinamide-GDP ribazoletransferase
MRFVRSMIISFSLYSRIPMPVFKWDEKDMAHAIAFLPFTGAVIGLISYAFLEAAMALSLPVAVQEILLSLIPLVVTGGFHVDGFMDVSDARNSYLDKKRKLEIMKDPHVGAFAIVGLLIYCLIWGAALYLVVSSFAKYEGGRLGLCYSMVFFLSRAICGLTSVCYPKAKKDGMLNSETANSTIFDKVFLGVQALIAIAFLVWKMPGLALWLVAGVVLYALYYRQMCIREFGGVTGDTAGYLLCMLEEVMVVIMAIWCLL